MNDHKIKGSATLEGTKQYAARFEGKLAPSHFRLKDNLYFSSLGMGTYLGEPDALGDEGYAKAMEVAVASGMNVIDSAINYRAQRSERVIGQVLTKMIQAGKIKREEVIIATKGGFLPFDGDYPQNAEKYFRENYIETGILKSEDIAQGCHAMTPAYLEDQLQKSLNNLNLETLDIYYLHNPESQLAEHDRKTFLEALKLAFEWAETKVKEGKIKRYGLATWNGFRIHPEKEDYLSLEEVGVLARQVGGPDHHFKAIELPYNLAMPEAWVLANQGYGGNWLSFFRVAEHMKYIVMGSASLLQARLLAHFPDFLEKYFKEFETSAQKCLQFARSAPGMTTALVGMKSAEHVQENLKVAAKDPLREDQMILMFQEAK